MKNWLSLLFISLNYCFVEIEEKLKVTDTQYDDDDDDSYQVSVCQDSIKKQTNTWSLSQSIICFSPTQYETK